MNGFVLRSSVAALVLLVLSACSWLPVPYTVDLKTRLGSNASGTAEHSIGAGAAGDIDLRHPEPNGECVDFSDANLPVTIRSARLHYNATVDYDGPRLSGRVTAQLYLAHDPNRLWLSSNKVGPQVTVNLANADTRLAGTAVLNREQVDGMNAGRLCWGLQISGEDIAATDSGTATLDYSIEQLRLDTRVSVI